jgi:hypothetical protein
MRDELCAIIPDLIRYPLLNSSIRPFVNKKARVTNIAVLFYVLMLLYFGPGIATRL